MVGLVGLVLRCFRGLSIVYSLGLVLLHVLLVFRGLVCLAGEFV